MIFRLHCLEGVQLREGSVMVKRGCFILSCCGKRTRSRSRTPTSMDEDGEKNVVHAVVSVQEVPTPVAVPVATPSQDQTGLVLLVEEFGKEPTAQAFSNVIGIQSMKLLPPPVKICDEMVCTSLVNRFKGIQVNYSQVYVFEHPIPSGRFGLNELMEIRTGDLKRGIPHYVVYMGHQLYMLRPQSQP